MRFLASAFTAAARLIAAQTILIPFGAFRGAFRKQKKPRAGRKITSSLILVDRGSSVRKLQRAARRGHVDLPIGTERALMRHGWYRRQLRLAGVR